MTTLTARRLLTDIGAIEYPVLTISDEGTLSDISSDPLALSEETDTLTAAFLDIHTHGALGHDVMSATPAELSELQRFLARHGVAHYLPTTVTASVDITLRSLEALANAIEAAIPENEARPLGIHLEGPFLSHAKRGVHPAEHLQPPDPALFDRFQGAARGHILLMTVAPEISGGPFIAQSHPVMSGEQKMPGSQRSDTQTPGAPPVTASSSRVGSTSVSPASEAASRYPKPSGLGLKAGREKERALAPEGSPSSLDLIRHATAQNVRISLGHSNAPAEETIAAIDAGAISATHTFNAMRPLDHREPGILGTVLDDDRLYAELICDGIHVAPPLVRLWLKAKGPSGNPARAILVTDSMSATGMPDGAYTLGGLPVTVANYRAVLTNDLAAGKETLAGSLLTLDRAVANCQHFTGCSLAHAVRFASDNPARMLGRPELTRLAPGSPANLNRFNAQGDLIATYLRGKQIPR